MDLIHTRTQRMSGEKWSEGDLRASGMLTLYFPHPAPCLYFFSFSSSGLVSLVKAHLQCYPSTLSPVCCIRNALITEFRFMSASSQLQQGIHSALLNPTSVPQVSRGRLKLLCVLLLSWVVLIIAVLVTWKTTKYIKIVTLIHYQS